MSKDWTLWEQLGSLGFYTHGLSKKEMRHVDGRIILYIEAFTTNAVIIGPDEITRSEIKNEDLIQWATAVLRME